MKKNLIIVGNGSTATQSNLGKEIDSFDNVVRFSWFWIDGFEEKVGTRTDIWATTVYCQSRISQNSFRRVVAHSWQWDPAKCKTFKLLKKEIPFVEKLTSNLIDEMSELIGLEKRYCFSTGALMAWFFLKERDYITIHGFDWAYKDPPPRHHYGDCQSMGTLHNLEHEYSFFKKLKEDNKLSFL